MEPNRETEHHEGTWRERVKEDVAGWPRWKKIVVAGAGVCVVAGGVLAVVGGGEGPAAAPAPGGVGPDGVAHLVDPGAAPPDGEGAGSSWAPVFLRFGFSFFVGFAIGTAARSVLKLVLVFCGIFAVALFGLSEFGFVEVHWDAMGESFDGFVGKIGEEAESVSGLLTGRLPSVGLAVLGLAAGFKKGS